MDFFSYVSITKNIFTPEKNFYVESKKKKKKQKILVVARVTFLVFLTKKDCTIEIKNVKKCLDGDTSQTQSDDDIISFC